MASPLKESTDENIYVPVMHLLTLAKPVALSVVSQYTAAGYGHAEDKAGDSYSARLDTD